MNVPVAIRDVHETLLHADTLRPEDRERLRAIFDAIERSDDWHKLMHAYYRDTDQADRTPRAMLYLHIGFLLGDRARDERRPTE